MYKFITTYVSSQFQLLHYPRHYLIHANWILISDFSKLNFRMYLIYEPLAFGAHMISRQPNTNPYILRGQGARLRFSASKNLGVMVETGIVFFDFFAETGRGGNGDFHFSGNGRHPWAGHISNDCGLILVHLDKNEPALINKGRREPLLDNPDHYCGLCFQPKGRSAVFCIFVRF